MLHNIMIGIDRSAGSASVQALAIEWSRRLHAGLVGIGVVDEPAIRSPTMTPIGGDYYKELSDDARLAEARGEVAQLLAQFQKRCADANVPCRIIQAAGDPLECLQIEAQRFDLIMLGLQTHFQFATQSSADAWLPTLLKNTPRPIVIVPPEPAHGRSVVIAYDGSLQAARTLQAFVGAGLDRLADVHVLAVGSDTAALGAHVDRAMEFLASYAIFGTRHVVAASSSIGETILEQAKRLDARLLMLGTYGQSTLREFFLGSVTRTVLRAATAPLFLYH